MAVTRHEEISDALARDILRGRYRVGERLPSERDLAARFGANRGAAREAVKKLEQMGIVADEMIRALQDTSGGTVVLLQLDQLQARKVLLQQGQVFRAGSAPGVYRLVVVTYGSGLNMLNYRMNFNLRLV